MNTDDPAPAEPPEGPAPEPRDRQHRQHGYRGKFERSMDTVARDARAAELRGQGLTYQQIADELGIGNRGDAWRAVQNAKADVARPAAKKLIATESSELDNLYIEALAILERHHVTVSHGKVITWRNPETQQEEPLADDGPKLAAIRVALDIRKAYQELHGLKQPSRISVEAERLGREIGRLLDTALSDEDGPGDDLDA